MNERKLKELMALAQLSQALEGPQQQQQQQQLALALQLMDADARQRSAADAQALEREKMVAAQQLARDDRAMRSTERSDDRQFSREQLAQALKIAEMGQTAQQETNALNAAQQAAALAVTRQGQIEAGDRAEAGSLLGLAERLGPQDRDLYLTLLERATPKLAGDVARLRESGYDAEIAKLGLDLSKIDDPSIKSQMLGTLSKGAQARYQATAPMPDVTNVSDTGSLFRGPASNAKVEFGGDPTIAGIYKDSVYSLFQDLGALLTAGPRKLKAQLSTPLGEPDNFELFPARRQVVPAK